VLVCNKEAIALKLPAIARALDLPGRDFSTVLKWILDLRKELGVPHSLGELGVMEVDAKAIAADAVRDPTAGSNPRPLSEADFERVITAAIRGEIGG
jgi:alcohol dehydrogenase class IV